MQRPNRVRLRGTLRVLIPDAVMIARSPQQQQQQSPSGVFPSSSTWLYLASRYVD